MSASEAEIEAADVAVFNAMIDHGPDGHTDGHEEIARAAIEAVEPLLRERLAQEVEAANWGHSPDIDWVQAGAARIVRGGDQ